MGETKVEQLTALLEHASEGLMVHDTEGVLRYVNQRFCSVLGYTQAELMQLRVFDIEVGLDEAKVRQIWRLMADGEVVDLEGHHRTKSGETIVTRVKARCDDSLGERLFYIATREALESYDFVISVNRELESIQQRLVASEASYRALLDTTREAIMVFDWDSALCLYANDAACELFGYSREELAQFTGRMLQDPSQAEQVDAVSARLHAEGRAAGRLLMRRKSGEVFWGEYTITVYETLNGKRMVDVFRDVSESVRYQEELERKNEELTSAQARLLHADRLATIGQMAASIAHEINNPAAYVVTNLQALRALLEGAAPTEPWRDEFMPMVMDSLDGIQRILATTRDLKSFSRLDQQEATWVDLNEVVRVAAKLATNELRHRAALRLDLRPLPRVAGSEGKLTQVLVNLLINAAHAVERTVAADEAQVTVTSRLERREIAIEVRDNGPGVPQQIRDQLFQPFVTTKTPDRGTGLGLSLCAEIMRAHGGGIQLVETERGACFRIRVPIETGLKVSPASGCAPVQPTRRLKVLLVDDEPLLLKSQERLLKRRFDVLTAPGGEEALKRLRTDPDVDLVLCDLMMPAVDGVEFRERVRAELPEYLSRVHFCSGGAFTDRVRSYLAANRVLVLDKPLSAEVLEDLASRGMSEYPLAKN
ncbi:MAG: PAS domain S-box protein [Polyangiaceae bacterium]|nr:PAS domain S-box protein [Myxococcales bacterium]MCB9585947.1 PAS domain S-box protein [Polyangiaceae bacterium]